MDIDEVSTEPQHVPVIAEDEDYGTDIELDADLEALLVEAESQIPVPLGTHETPEATLSGQDRPRHDLTDMEDFVSLSTENLSPFQMFRGKGRLSVSDLVGTVWCEVQVGTRLFHRFNGS